MDETARETVELARKLQEDPAGEASSPPEPSFAPPPWRWYPLRYRLRRALNRRRNRREYRRREVVLRSTPTVLALDPTNICQLRCPLCATGTGAATHRKGLMPFDLFKRIVDRLGPSLYELHLYNWGEPLLNKSFCDMIEYASRYPIRIGTSTNLNYLPEALADRLVRSGLTHLTVSADGMSEETYRKYRVGGSFEKMMSNLRLLAEKKRKYGLEKYPRIIFRFMVMRHNEHELEQARAFAEENGFRFRKKSVRIDMNDFSRGSIEEKLERDDKATWLAEEAKHNRYRKRKRKADFGARVCKDLWQRAFVAWDGSVHPCCNTFNAEDFFTNTWDSDFWKLWNGQRYQAARKLFRGEYDPDRDGWLICKPCTDQGNHLFVS